MINTLNDIKEYGFMGWFRHTKLYDMFSYITVVFPERLSRSFSFAKEGWLNYDFDADYVHELVLFKLKRMEYTFIHHGYHSEECENYIPKMKSLKLCIKLLDIYCNDKSAIHMNHHTRQWGELKMYTVKAEISETYGQLFKIISERPFAVTKEEKGREREGSRIAYEADHNRNERILATAYKIVAKYHRHWWD